MADSQLKRAIQLIKNGEKNQARQILLGLLQIDPHQETAWIWLAETAQNDTERLGVLRSCLKYNPQSRLASHAIQAILARQEEQATPAPAPILTQGEAEDRLQEIANLLGMQAQPPANNQSPSLQHPPEPQVQPSSEVGQESVIDHTLIDLGEEKKIRKHLPRWIWTVFFSLLAVVVLGAVILVLILDNPFASSAPTPNRLPSPTSLPPTTTPTLPAETLPTQTPRPTWTPYISPTFTLTPSLTYTPSPTPTITPLTFVALPRNRQVLSPQNLARIGSLGELGAGAVYAPRVNWLAKIQNNAAVVWNATTNSEINRFTLEFGFATGLAISPQGSWLACSNTTFLVQVWNLPANRLIHTFGTGSALSIPPDSSAEMLFSSDENYLAISNKGVLSVWDMRNTQQPVAYFSSPQELIQNVTQDPKIPAFFSLDFSPDNRYLVASGYHVILIIDLPNQTTTIIDTPDVLQHVVKFSPDGKTIGASGPGFVRLIDPISTRELTRLEGALFLDGFSTPFAFSPQSDAILILNFLGECCGPTVIERYSIPQAKLIESSAAYDLPPAHFEFSPNGEIFLVQIPGENATILRAGNNVVILSDLEFPVFLPDQTGIVGLVNDVPVLFGVLP